MAYLVMTDQRIVHRLAVLIVVLALIVAAAVLTATSTYPDSPQVSVSMAASASKPPPVYGSAVRCMTADAANDKLAARMAEDKSASLASRSSSVGLDVTDNQTGISCWYQSSRYFIAASVVKVTILAALLHKQMAEHQKLSHDQATLCWEMITDSDDYAASILWDEVGRAGLQQFLGLARMTDTKLGPGGYWGLTKITAADEVRLLRLITSPNSVLDQKSRIYAKYLMSQVTQAQRWGVPAGAPPGVQAHVKNGWLPHPGYSDWRINSIGAFTGPRRVYLIAILTEGNPTMASGVRAIQGAAEVIHHDLNARPG